MAKPRHRDRIDIRLEGAHKVALERLQVVYDLNTAVKVVRRLIFEAAQQAGVWPETPPSEPLP